MTLRVRGLAPLLQVFDMPRSLAFYRDALGFTVVESSAPGDDADWVLLSLDGAEIMLNTAYEGDARPSVPAPARVAAHRDTTIYFGCPDVEAAYAHLRAHGIHAEPPSTAPYGMRQLCTSDPDGYLLCFQRPASKEQEDAWRARYGSSAAG